MGCAYLFMLEADSFQGCRACAGANLTCLGYIGGGNLYECRDCGATTRVRVREAELPCPYCGAQCIVRGWGQGKKTSRLRRYYCSTCKHTSCNLYPADRLENLNGYCCKTNLYLDLGAQVGLNEFCQRFRMRETEAVRAIFRASRFATLVLPERSGFLARMAAREGRPCTEPVRSPEAITAGLPIGDVEAEVHRLPDARPQASRARMAGRAVWEACHERPVDLVQQVTVALDRTAVAGLLRAMTFLDTTNQQVAARFLLTDAVNRFAAFVVLPPLRGVKPGGLSF